MQINEISLRLEGQLFSELHQPVLEEVFEKIELVLYKLYYMQMEQKDVFYFRSGWTFREEWLALEPYSVKGSHV